MTVLDVSSDVPDDALRDVDRFLLNTPHLLPLFVKTTYSSTIILDVFAHIFFNCDFVVSAALQMSIARPKSSPFDVRSLSLTACLSHPVLVYPLLNYPLMYRN